MAATLAAGIPLVFHRIWLGGPIPDDLVEYGASFRRHHPDWQLTTWTESNLPPLHNQALFDAASSYAMKADIARYELVCRFGGVYIDSDFASLRPLDPLVDHLGCFFAMEDGRWLTNAIFGAWPGHPFLHRLVRGLDDSVSGDPTGPPNVVTGPQYLSRVYAGSPEAQRSGVALLPAPMLLPYHFSEPERAGEPFPDAFAVHHWSHAW